MVYNGDDMIGMSIEDQWKQDNEQNEAKIAELEAQVDAMGDQYIRAQDRGAELEAQVLFKDNVIEVLADWMTMPYDADKGLDWKAKAESEAKAKECN